MQFVNRTKWSLSNIMVFNLEGLEEVEAGLSEDDPQLLPPVRRLELAKEVSGQQRAQRTVVITHLRQQVTLILIKVTLAKALT